MKKVRLGLLFKLVLTIFGWILFSSCNFIEFDRRPASESTETYEQSPIFSDSEFKPSSEEFKLKERPLEIEKSSISSSYFRNVAIYGQDDRTIPDKVNSRFLRRRAHFSVGLTKSSKLPVKKVYCSGSTQRYRGKRFTLIADHCLGATTNCENINIVRNFEVELDRTSSKRQILHKCQKIIYRNGALDIAMIQVSEPVEPEAPDMYGLKFKISKTQVGDQLAVIGHAEGNPKVVASNCEVLGFVGFYIKHECDTFRGNSGSEVVNLSREGLAGVQVRGAKDRGRRSVIIYPHDSQDDYAEYSLDLEPIAKSLQGILSGRTVEMVASRSGEEFVSMTNPIEFSLDFSKDSTCLSMGPDSAAKHIAEVLNDNPKFDRKSLKISKLQFGQRMDLAGEDLPKKSGETSKIFIKGCSKSEILGQLQSRLDYLDFLKGVNFSKENIEVICNIKEAIHRCQEVSRHLKALIGKQKSRETLDLEKIYLVAGEGTLSGESFIDISVGKTKEEIELDLLKRLNAVRQISNRYFFRVGGIKISSSFREKPFGNEHPDYAVANRIYYVLRRYPHLNAKSLNADKIYIEDEWDLDAKGTWINVARGASLEEIRKKLENAIVNKEEANKKQAI